VTGYLPNLKHIPKITLTRGVKVEECIEDKFYYNIYKFSGKPYKQSGLMIVREEIVRTYFNTLWIKNNIPSYRHPGPYLVYPLETYSETWYARYAL